MKRRNLLISMGLASLSAPLIGGAGENPDDDELLVPGADEETELLFVQHADSVKLTDGQLELVGVGGSVLYFSDRPEHLVGHWALAEFLDNWDTGGDMSFQALPPNAALSIMTSHDLEDILVVLKNPRLENQTLVYDVEVLEGPSVASGETAALFIDTIGNPLSPGSVAGVHRRHRRRRRQRIRH